MRGKDIRCGRSNTSRDDWRHGGRTGSRHQSKHKDDPRAKRCGRCKGAGMRMVVAGQQLEEGQWYILTTWEKCGANKRKKQIKRRMRLVKCYPHHAQFETQKGIRTSYRYWDLQWMLTGRERPSLLPGRRQNVSKHKDAKGTNEASL